MLEKSNIAFLFYKENIMSYLRNKEPPFALKAKRNKRRKDFKEE